MANRYDDGSWGDAGDPQDAAANEMGGQLLSLNQAMENDPVMQQWMQGHGGGQRALSDREKVEYHDLMEQQGYHLLGDTEIADNGQVAPEDHNLRNRMIFLSLLAPTAAYLAFGGAAGGAAVAPALGDGSTLAADLGGASALAAPTAAAIPAAAAVAPALGGGSTLAGDLAGAGALDTAVPTATAATLPSSALTLSNGAPLPSSVAPVAGGAGIASPLVEDGILTKVGKYAKDAEAVAQGIGAATDQAAQNRIAQNDPYVSRAKLEDTERNQALRDLYAADRMMNPTNSPFDPRPRTAPTGDYAATLASLTSQDAARLQKPSQYNANTLPSLAPSTLEKVGDWVAPTLSILSRIGKYYTQ